jgi:purine-binding chemotaxis protein CheW
MMSEDLVVLELARQQYALSVRQVREVLPRATLTTLAGAPVGVLGILSLRGSLLPVLDLRQRLGLPAVSPSIGQCIVVTDLEHSTVGLLVDAVVGLAVDAQTGQTNQAGLSVPRDSQLNLVRQVVELDGRVVSILDPDDVAGAEIAAYVSTVTRPREALPGAVIGASTMPRPPA